MKELVDQQLRDELEADKISPFQNGVKLMIEVAYFRSRWIEKSPSRKKLFDLNIRKIR